MRMLKVGSKVRRNPRRHTVIADFMECGECGVVEALSYECGPVTATVRRKCGSKQHVEIDLLELLHDIPNPPPPCYGFAAHLN